MLHALTAVIVVRICDLQTGFSLTNPAQRCLICCTCRLLWWWASSAPWRCLREHRQPCPSKSAYYLPEYVAFLLETKVLGNMDRFDYALSIGQHKNTYEQRKRDTGFDYNFYGDDAGPFVSFWLAKLSRTTDTQCT